MKLFCLLRHFLMLGFVCCSLQVVSQTVAQPVNVYAKQQDGYACFRIPAVVRSTHGMLLAFAEGRKKSCSDTGDIDLVLKRSADGGLTWSSLVVVWDDGGNVCGNPVPMVDEKTGRIVLLSCWNRGDDSEGSLIKQTSHDIRRVYVLYSDDDGLTWSVPREITSQVKRSGWAWYATGPCHGIQMKTKAFRGRLVAPANHITAGGSEYHSQLLYSDDGGNHWSLGGVTDESGGNESCVAELSNGNLLLNMRNYNRKAAHSRAVVASIDGGKTLSSVGFCSALIEPVCQGSLLGMVKRSGKQSSTLIFSNPASTTRREKMTVRLSDDDGLTWPYACCVYDGPSAYSDLVQLTSREVGLLFEYGVANAYENIGFTRLQLKQLRKP